MVQSPSISFSRDTAAERGSPRSAAASRLNGCGWDRLLLIVTDPGRLRQGKITQTRSFDTFFPVYAPAAGQVRSAENDRRFGRAAAFGGSGATASFALFVIFGMP